MGPYEVLGGHLNTRMMSRSVGEFMPRTPTMWLSSQLIRSTWSPVADADVIQSNYLTVIARIQEVSGNFVPEMFEWFHLDDIFI